MPPPTSLPDTRRRAPTRQPKRAAAARTVSQPASAEITFHGFKLLMMKLSDYLRTYEGIGYGKSDKHETLVGRFFPQISLF